MQRPLTHRIFGYALILTMIGSVFSVVLPAIKPSFASHENITLNIGDAITRTYDGNDAVGINGVIEDEVTGEDVIIRIGEPGDSTPDEVQTDEPGSGGVFDYVYEVPSSPEEGVYTVEVEYDDEFAYTYFIVDDENDTITIELIDHDDGIYEAGDDLEIAGSVDNEDLGAEEFVHIIVLDPTNEEIENESEVELGADTLSNNEFEHTVQLENNAPHGRYAVIVTYDIDNQEGSTIFEIEDTDAGSGGGDGNGDSDSDGDLSAEIEEATYEPSDPVTLSGTINSYDSEDNEDLEIIVEDPDGNEVDAYGDSNANVDNNGDFDYEFDLADDAEEGAYTVIITYISDEIQLDFEVEDTGTGGGGGGTTEDLTVKLNKASYLAGETMTVSGTVADVASPADEEEVSILLYRPTGQVILEASKFVTPSSNGVYNTTLVLASNLDPDEDYQVKVSYLNDEAQALFDIVGVSPTPSDEITMETDREEYAIASTVSISGQVPSAMVVQGQQAFLRVDKPDGNPCRTDQINIPTTGTFSYSFPLGGNCGVTGEYEVIVSYRGNEGSTNFELVGASASGYNLNVDGKTYSIAYELTTGSLERMFVQPEADRLVVLMAAEQGGQLTLVLPREVIDAVQNGTDIDYMVSIEDESGEITSVNVEESENTDQSRTLVIDYPAGAGRVEITGTQVVPEFGSVAAIIMAIAIVGTIVATARFGNKFNFFRQ